MTRGGNRGFTLIEVVVALAILSLCTMVLYQGLEVALSGWRTAVSRSVDQDSVTTAQRFLRARLESLSPFRPGASGGAAAAVTGTDQELEFTGAAPSAMGPGELRYELRLRRGRAGNEFLVRWRRAWDGRIDRVADAWHEEAILQDARSLEFQYLAIDPVAGPTWRSEWRSRTAAPALIRVFVTFEPGDRRRWSHFTVKPLIDADPRCDFDPVSRACRDQ
jgi:general secretion pathway protein J